LLKESGLRYQKARRSATEADEAEQEEFHDELNKLTTAIDTALNQL
jgi:transposase